MIDDEMMFEIVEEVIGKVCIKNGKLSNSDSVQLRPKMSEKRQLRKSRRDNGFWSGSSLSP